MKRQTAKGSAVSVVVALTLSNGCSLQDFEYLGAGEPTETSDDKTTDDDTDDPTTSGSGSLDGGTDSGDADADVDAAPPAEGGSDTDTTVTTDTTTEDPTSDTSSTDTVSTEQTTEPDAGPTLPVVVDPDNLLTNASFESGLGSWVPLGNARIVNTSAAARSGEQGVLTTARTQVWEGPSLNVVNMLEPGQSYRFSGWVRLAVAPEDGFDQRMGVTLKYVCRYDSGVGMEMYMPIASTNTQTSWSKIDGIYTIPDCDVVIMVIYFEGAPPGAEFYLDDVSIVPN